MALEIFIWSWLNLHPVYALKKTAKLLTLAMLILAPLFYLNVDMVRKGYKLHSPSLNIQVAQHQDQYLDP